ncbi:MAG: DUF3422 domain-containing protein [Pseudomonadota bacterium]
MPLTNHPGRIPLTEELHARPFPVIDAPAKIYYLALRMDDPNSDALQTLAEHLGLPAPEKGNHYYGSKNTTALKWEQHTEFQTFTLISKPKSKGFPDAWLTSLNAAIVTRAKIDMLPSVTTKDANTYLIENLSGPEHEALAVTAVLDRDAILACDFKIGADDHVAMVILPIGQVGPHRLGRIAQRLLEIETYRAMSMLTLPIAREVFGRINALDKTLSDLVDQLIKPDAQRAEILDALSTVSAELEALNAAHSYRFSAGTAYSEIVKNRISILREERVLGRQTFHEFFMRRFQPAMNTCTAAEQRLAEITKRAARAFEMLSTRANLLATEQNIEVLAALNKRSELQLRLQETVEGLSVVAISYYGVNLLGYLISPIAVEMGFDKTMAKAALVLPVVIGTWLGIRFAKRRFFGKNKKG